MHPVHAVRLGTNKHTPIAMPPWSTDHKINKYYVLMIIVVFDSSIWNSDVPRTVPLHSAGDEELRLHPRKKSKLYMHLSIYLSIYLSLSLYISTYMYISLSLYIYIYMYLSIYLSGRTWLNAPKGRLHTYIHTYIHMYVIVPFRPINAHIYIYV